MMHREQGSILLSYLLAMTLALALSGVMMHLALRIMSDARAINMRQVQISNQAFLAAYFGKQFKHIGRIDLRHQPLLLRKGADYRYTLQEQLRSLVHVSNTLVQIPSGHVFVINQPGVGDWVFFIVHGTLWSSFSGRHKVHWVDGVSDFILNYTSLPVDKNQKRLKRHVLKMILLDLQHRPLYQIYRVLE